MRLHDEDKNLLYPVVHSHLTKLKETVAAWDALPEDVVVSDEESRAVIQARREIPMMQMLLDRITKGEPEVILPIQDNLDEDDLDTVKSFLNHLTEAKHYVDRAGDALLKMDHLEHMFPPTVSDIYLDLERMESQVINTFPQLDDEGSQPDGN